MKPDKVSLSQQPSPMVRWRKDVFNIIMRTPFVPNRSEKKARQWRAFLQLLNKIKLL